MTATSFNEEQRKILSNDLANSIDIESVIPSITHKPDLAFFLHLVRTISHIDHDFSEQERRSHEP